MWLGRRVVVAGLQPSYSQEITFKLLTQVKTFLITEISRGEKQLLTFLTFYPFIYFNSLIYFDATRNSPATKLFDFLALY